jgi:hypothetical protein
MLLEKRYLQEIHLYTTAILHKLLVLCGFAVVQKELHPNEITTAICCVPCSRCHCIVHNWACCGVCARHLPDSHINHAPYSRTKQSAGIQEDQERIRKRWSGIIRDAGGKTGVDGQIPWCPQLSPSFGFENVSASLPVSAPENRKKPLPAGGSCPVGLRSPTASAWI